MIQLSEFVAESLKQIIDGITNAQDYAEDKKAFVNPKGLIQLPTHMIVGRGAQEQNPIPQLIEFDVAVTASESTEAKAGIGVFAAAIGIGTQAKLQDGNVTLSRLRFSIPVLFPEQKEK